MSSDAKAILGIVGIVITMGTVVPLFRFFVMKYFEDIKKEIAEMKDTDNLQWTRIDEHKERLQHIELVHDLLRCEGKIAKRERR